jgi:hypothetical protein
MPFESHAVNKMEIFNEACVLASSHWTAPLLNPTAPDSVTNAVGWILVAITIFNVSVNIGNVGMSSV